MLQYQSQTNLKQANQTMPQIFNLITACNMNCLPLLSPVWYPKTMWTQILLLNSQPHISDFHVIIAASPINMFHHEQLEEHAFPVLYPKGRFGLGYSREKAITDLKYLQCRLFNKDSRWRDNVTWMFWALNTFEMHKLQNEISILSRIKKHNNQFLTAADLTNPTSKSLSQSYMFMKNIRGTAAYWKDQLLAKINTLGPPTFFVILTANDLHWPDVNRPHPHTRGSFTITIR